MFSLKNSTGYSTYSIIDDKSRTKLNKFIVMRYSHICSILYSMFIATTEMHGYSFMSLTGSRSITGNLLRKNFPPTDVIIGFSKQLTIKSVADRHGFDNKINDKPIAGETFIDGEVLPRVWQSGYILSDKRKENNGGRFRNDPWWMRDEEKNNPRIRARYSPWWLRSSANSTEFATFSKSWKVADLRKEAKLRGIPADESKAELIIRLNSLASKYRLTDDNFTAPTFTSVPTTEANSCYPEVYEGGLQQVEQLRVKANLITASNDQ